MTDNLNYIATGGQFDRKRRYPGFTLSRNKVGGISIKRDSDGRTIGSAGTMAGVAWIMCGYVNPYTGEAFTKD